mmetsp:Transcript_19682/g.31299  ORF Transcript_19682/g.31299 Transcript_19682/m.31299 type:complete len:201 (+) Transcript_19682:255-857(+)
MLQMNAFAQFLVLFADCIQCIDRTKIINIGIAQMNLDRIWIRFGAKLCNKTACIAKEQRTVQTIHFDAINLLGLHAEIAINRLLTVVNGAGNTLSANLQIMRTLPRIHQRRENESRCNRHSQIHQNRQHSHQHNHKRICALYFAHRAFVNIALNVLPCFLRQNRRQYHNDRVPLKRVIHNRHHNAHQCSCRNGGNDWRSH